MSNKHKMQKQVVAPSQKAVAIALDGLAKQIQSHLEMQGYENLHVKVAERNSLKPVIHITSAKLFIDEFGRETIAGQGPVSLLLSSLKHQLQEVAP